MCYKKELQQLISLGEQYIVNFSDSENQNGFKARLDLVLCNESDGGCGLLQLKHTVPGELLYRNFWYKSGVNQSMRDALKNITDRIKEKIPLNSDDIIIDIGANDGTLLRTYDRNDLTLVGFEPAKNLIDDAKIGTSKIINDFFNFNSLGKFRLLKIFPIPILLLPFTKKIIFIDFLYPLLMIFSILHQMKYESLYQAVQDFY